MLVHQRADFGYSQRFAERFRLNAHREIIGREFFFTFHRRANHLGELFPGGFTHKWTLTRLGLLFGREDFLVRFFDLFQGRGKALVIDQFLNALELAVNEFQQCRVLQLRVEVLVLLDVAG